MLKQLEGPDGVLVFTATGQVGKADYETILEPAVDAMLAERGEVRLVYVLGDDYEGFSSGAAWQDAKLGFDHWSKWKRIALVTDHDWLSRSIGLFGWIVPGQVKTFALADQQAAVDWAAS